MTEIEEIIADLQADVNDMHAHYKASKGGDAGISNQYKGKAMGLGAAIARIRDSFPEPPEAA